MLICNMADDVGLMTQLVMTNASQYHKHTDIHAVYL